jgi:hypothetical protein
MTVTLEDFRAAAQAIRGKVEASAHSVNKSMRREE